VQSFYGVWDKNDAATGDPISAQTVISFRTQLLEQTISNVVVGTNTFRVVSQNLPTWSEDIDPPEATDSLGDPPTHHMGWRMDFPNAATTGERSVFRPILTAGRLIFNTLIPSVLACQFGGTSFLMIVDPTTGARIDGAVLDVDNNGQLNTSDQVTFGTGQVYASGVQSGIGITPTPTIVKTQSGTTVATGAASQIFGTTGPLVAGAGVLLAYALAAGSSGGNASTMIGLSASGGRVSWRELLIE
jgi:type IV pilus assembly protein PilY1